MPFANDLRRWYWLGWFDVRVFSENKKNGKNQEVTLEIYIAVLQLLLEVRTGKSPYRGNGDICASCHFRSSTETLLPSKAFVPCYLKKTFFGSVSEYCLYKISRKGNQLLGVPLCFPLVHALCMLASCFYYKHRSWLYRNKLQNSSVISWLEAQFTENRNSLQACECFINIEGVSQGCRRGSPIG